jgi:demethylmenaquinone methyltransferase/2-methoxy-6-polyprenyl-1,4-benzoquinol methylase
MPTDPPTVPASPTFARDSSTAEYYDRRSAEYDQWYTGDGLFAERERPGWHQDVETLISVTKSLPAAKTLDIACGTGFLTRHLRGLVVGLDQSPAMVALTQSRIPDGIAMVGDALSLPFADGAFDRVFTGHFYGHLGDDERAAFLSEAHRVARQLVVVDAAVRPGIPAEGWQERVLNDGSRHRVYKRYFTPAQLAEEIDGSVLMAGEYFVAAVSAGGDDAASGAPLGASTTLLDPPAR